MPTLTESNTSSQTDISDQEIMKTEKLAVQAKPLKLVDGKMLYIKTKSGDMVKLSPNTTQTKIFNKIVELRKANKPIRIWLLKYRQGGVSTLIESVIYALTSQQDNINSLILADEKEHANNLFEMSKLYQEKLEQTDPHLTIPLKKSNEKKLEFEGIHSQIIIASAENTEAAKSHTFQLVHLCMSENTLVLVNDNRMKRIQDVSINDKIVTHLGHIAKVKGISTNKASDISDHLLSIRTSGNHCRPIECTPNHKIFTRDKKQEIGSRKDGRGVWKEAKDIKKGDMLGIPLRIVHHKFKDKTYTIAGKEAKANFELGYVFGIYLAEGCIIYNKGKNGRLPSAVCFTMGQGEEWVLDIIASKAKEYISSYSFKRRKDSKTIQGICYGSKFAKFILNELGHKDTKHIPNKYFSYPKQFLLGLLDGYFKGDGHYGKDMLAVTSIRPQILFQIRDLLLGMRIGYSSIDFRKAGTYYGRNCSNTWCLRLHGATYWRMKELFGGIKMENHFHFKSDWRLGRKHCWVKVDGITKTNCDKVYDIVLDHKDHSYRHVSGVAVHNSEVAYFRDLKTVLGDLNQTVPDLPGTMVVGETTANGMEEFYKQWLRAIEGKTSWIPMFFPWFEMDEYSMPLQNGALYPLEGVIFDADTSLQAFEQEEMELQAEFKLSDEQLNWRRYKIVNGCQGDLNVFKREYPATWQEAFSMSGDLFFDRKGLDKQIEKRPIAQGEIFFQNLKWEWRDLKHGRIQLFERPQAGEQYIVAGDASEATGSGDEAAVVVLNKRLNSTAAQVVGQITPEDLAQIEIALGNFFNQALIAQESKGYGYQVNQLINASYGNIYRKVITKDGIEAPTDELGFNTTSVTRPSMLAQLAEEIRFNSTMLYSKEIISECRTFIIKKDKEGKVTKVEAQTGYDDGLVICRAICSYVRNQYPYKAINTKDVHARQKALIAERRHKRGF